MKTTLTASQLHALAVLAPSARANALVLVSMGVGFEYAFRLVSA